MDTNKFTAEEAVALINKPIMMRYKVAWEAFIVHNISYSEADGFQLVGYWIDNFGSRIYLSKQDLIEKGAKAINWESNILEPII